MIDEKTLAKYSSYRIGIDPAAGDVGYIVLSSDKWWRRDKTFTYQLDTLAALSAVPVAVEHQEFLEDSATVQTYYLDGVRE